MRLAKVHLRNFRCYQEEIVFEFEDLTVLVGCNEAGKSALLDALAIFFGEEKMDSDDASIGGDASDVRITCEFDDLPEQLVIDANYPTSLTGEHLLNEDGHLEVCKVYNAGLKTPRLSRIFAHALHPTTPERDDLLQLRITELRDRAKQLGIDTSEVDLKISSAIRKAIWDNAPDLEIVATEIPLDQETGKKIWAQLETYLPTYALFKSDRSSTDQDTEAQDPMKAAVKEAIKSQEQELHKIAQHVEREVEAIAARTVEKLKEMHPSLASELKPRFASPNWASVFKISLTGDDAVPINKRGSGVRRLILLNFFRAKAEQRALERETPDVIYAIEEPETSQHPNNQRLLMQALCDLSDDPDCQVILTTHTPTLGRLAPGECLTYISFDDGGQRSVLSGTDETYRLVAEALGVLPDHDVELFVGVEGINDIHFLKGISRVLVDHGEDIPDLEQEEADGRIAFFPLGGGNLAYWTSRLENLNRPEFYVFDRDCTPPADPHYKAQADEINARDDCIAVHTGKKEMENYLHPDAITAVRSNVTVSFGDFDDVPARVAELIHGQSGSPMAWHNLSEERKRKKKAKVKAWLNRDVVRIMTPAMLDARDPCGEVRSWLQSMASFL